MLQKLRARHREIARLMIEGRKPAEISEELDLPLNTVHRISTDPLFKAHMAKLSDSLDTMVIQTRKRLAEMNAKALDTLDDLLTFDDVPAPTRLHAAKDVLDRNGFAPAQNVNHNHTHFTASDLQMLKERAISAGATIEAEYEYQDA